uniref:Uncharacterized protein n=1 Tax=Anguilla anguilla TaxID=7936 RepID=A0A0E9TY04_ANGAN
MSNFTLTQVQFFSTLPTPA